MMKEKPLSGMCIAGKRDSTSIQTRHHRILFWGCFFIFIGFLLCGCAGQEGASAEERRRLPDALAGKSFVYDELETGEGDALYTLSFSDSGYKLYQDNGEGLISSGTVTEEENRTLVFNGGEEEIRGSFTGSALEEAAVTLSPDGRSMKFLPASETAEYVYLSYLGVYESSGDGSESILILERWFEFYLYQEGRLIRGTYEIAKDGSAKLTAEDGTEISGTVEKQTPFDVRTVRFSLRLPQDPEDTEFVYAVPKEQYDAAHAMGTYTLALYDAGVFVIRGVDGFVKAMGTMEENGRNGTASYFPRSITGDEEARESCTVAFLKEKDTFYFPAETPFLPRSGNIDPETGFGSYWNAGTDLEFIRRAEKQDADARSLYPQNTQNTGPPAAGLILRFIR